MKIGTSFDLKALVTSFGTIVREMETSENQYLDSPYKGRDKGRGKGESTNGFSSSHGGRGSGEPPQNGTPSRGRGGYKGGSKNI